MTPLFCRKKRYFSTTSMLRDRYFGFPPLHKKANKVLQGGVSLPYKSKFPRKERRTRARPLYAVTS